MRRGLVVSGKSTSTMFQRKGTGVLTSVRFDDVTRKLLAAFPRCAKALGSPNRLSIPASDRPVMRVSIRATGWVAFIMRSQTPEMLLWPADGVL